MIVNVLYTVAVAPEADTPLRPGLYTIRIVEGGTYRNLASRRKYTLDAIDPLSGEITYRYTKGAGETIECTGAANDLAVVQAVGDTPRALLQQPRGDAPV